MSRDAFAQLLRAARRRRFAATLAPALPWVAVAGVLAWRLGDGRAVPTLGTAVVTMLLAMAMARWSSRTLDRTWLERHLDANHPQLEDSSGLLAAEASRLPPLARLQRDRILQRLPSAEVAGVRAPWPLARILASVAIAALLIAAILLWPARSTVDASAGRSDSHAAAAAASAATGLVEHRLGITPPAYTGLPAREDTALDAKVPEGTTLAWTLRFNTLPDAVALEFVDGRRIALEHDGERWHGDAVAEQPGLYRIVASAARPWRDETLHRIDVTRDLPPTIRVTAPAHTLSLRTPGQRRWTLAFEAEDDHGLAASADMHLTMTEGSGENIRFRDEVRPLGGRGDRHRRRFTQQLDLDALGLAEGDDLIVYFEVHDNRPGRAQSARSASHILRWPMPQARDDDGMDGVLQKVLPAYFASQRQIIIDAEALIAERPRLQDEAFGARSDAIAVDQRLLRLRYGQFLGEESESAPTLPTRGQVDADDLPPPPILLPTSDAEDEADAWREMVSAAQEEAREHDGVNDGGHGGTATADGPGHDHASGDAPPPGEPGRSGFGEAGDVLEEFGHVHDIPEAATLLDPGTRVLLRRALGEMWQSELALRQARPRDALAPANRALVLVKEIQQADRIHLARTGTGLPPVDFSRRLSGDRAGIASRRALLARARLDEDVPAALWRALATPPVDDGIDLGALQAWLATNSERSSDPLAVMAAMDAVQRDPACDGCRERLRALLWPLTRPPAAAPLQRARPDAIGKAYLDALEKDDSE
ncbi:hypothetical protein WCE41_05740 [Luteimonas sp. MJ246]|uniref:hypothetical protein n=1 Tax=Luteimonas sp. MJ174 TaxID=3129237 RepID=UPI0031BB49F6